MRGIGSDQQNVFVQWDGERRKVGAGRGGGKALWHGGVWGGNSNQISIRREMLERPWKHVDHRPSMSPLWKMCAILKPPRCRWCTSSGSRHCRLRVPQLVVGEHTASLHASSADRGRRASGSGVDNHHPSPMKFRMANSASQLRPVPLVWRHWRRAASIPPCVRSLVLIVRPLEIIARIYVRLFVVCLYAWASSTCSLVRLFVCSFVCLLV